MILPNTACQPIAVAHHYDELDALYREVWGEHVHHGLWLTGKETTPEATLQLLAMVARCAKLKPGAIICDIGAGYGATARWLAHNYGAQVTALTLSPAQYAFAQA